MSHHDLRILVDARWRGMGGIGRFADELLARLEHWHPLPLNSSPVHPLDPWRVSRAIKHTPHTVFFTPGFNPPFRSEHPFILVMHDLIHLDDPQESTLAKRLYYRWFLRPALHRAFRVLTVSEYSRQRLATWAQLDPTHINVVGNGVSAAFQPTGESHQPGYPYLLYVGNRKPHKNVTGLLKAFDQLGASHEDVHLVMTGQCDASMRNLLQQVNRADRVIFAGNSDDAALAKLYRGAMALVMPSFIEGFGLPVVEAMACGTPVIASKTTSLPEVTGDAAILIDPNDTTMITTAMNDVLSKSDLRESLRARGLERAIEFDWDRVAQRVQAVLHEAAKTSV